MDPFYSNALDSFMALLGLGGGTTTMAKNVPPPGGVTSVPKGTSTVAAANPDFPQETLANAIGPWETTVTPAEAAGAASGEKTFGDKLSEALSGLGALQSPGVQMPSTGDILATARLALAGAPPTTALRLAEALLPRRR